MVLPAYGFFISVAEAGALRKVDCWANNGFKLGMVAITVMKTTRPIFKAGFRKVDPPESPF
jgi:hypothetical protein